MLVKLSYQAQLRIAEITDYYLFNESTERTQKVLESFEESFSKIAINHTDCKKYLSEVFSNLNIRIFKHYNTYHIYFMVIDDSIIIAEIFHLKQSGNKLKIDIENL